MLDLMLMVELEYFHLNPMITFISWRKNAMILFLVSHDLLFLVIIILHIVKAYFISTMIIIHAHWMRKDIYAFKRKSDKVMNRLRVILQTVDKEKVISISKRHSVENEAQDRKREMNDLEMLLQEKEKELNRIHEYYDSVKSVLSKQDKQMEKIRGF